MLLRLTTRVIVKEMVDPAAARIAIDSHLRMFNNYGYSIEFDVPTVEMERYLRRLCEIRSFLYDAELKRDTENSINEWLAYLINAVKHSYDFCDGLYVGKEEVQPDKESWCQIFMYFFCSCTTCRACKIITVLEEHEEKAQKILSIASDLGLQQVAYDPAYPSPLMMQRMKLRSLNTYGDDDHIVGQAETISLLKDKLVGGGSNCLVVISILGTMGGIGKTATARKLYNGLDNGVFDCYAWVDVLETPKPQDIIQHLLQSFTCQRDLDNNNNMKLSSMEANLRNWLQTRKYCIVIDDVSRQGIEVWESLKKALPDNNKGSRVIVTTSDPMLAAQLDDNAYVHELRCLQDDENWDLFCRKALLGDNDDTCCPHDFEQLKLRFYAAEWRGLPLTTKVLRGLIFSEMVSQEDDREQLVRYRLPYVSIDIHSVLEVSFRDFTIAMKQCFLYVSMFPENSEIFISKLISLWVAEGFIEQEEVVVAPKILFFEAEDEVQRGKIEQGEVCPEDVAKAYLNELVGRSFIQKTSEDWAVDATCRVSHPLIRKFAIKKAWEFNFPRYFEKKSINEFIMACSAPRIPASSNKGGNHFLRNLEDMKTRSYPSQIGLVSHHTSFGFLKVLDLHHSDTNQQMKKIETPPEIVKLTHLRYLGLPEYTGGELPHDIGNLKNLQTISICGDPVMFLTMLPQTMEKLKNLRHLIGEFYNYSAIKQLMCLQTLGLEAEEWCCIDATNLSNLRSLSIVDIPKRPELKKTRFYDNFNKLTSLQTLILASKDAMADIPLLAIVKCCPSVTHISLRDQYLRGDIIQPDWVENLHEFAVNLEVVEQRVFYPKYDLLNAFERLPKLRALRIRVGLNSGEMQLGSSRTGGFPQLQTLRIEGCQDMKLVVAEESMPLLKRLELKGCRGCQVPDRFKDLVCGRSDIETDLMHARMEDHHKLLTRMRVRSRPHPPPPLSYVGGGHM